MLDDTSTNRNAGPANGTEPGTIGNNRAGCTSARQNSPRCALGAGPRTPPQTQLEPWRHRRPACTVAAAVAGDNADFAHGAVPCLACRPGNAGWHAGGASAAPLAGKQSCNSDLA